jgi:UDP-glucose 4-epimerase
VNLGTGNGSSVLDIIEAVSAAMGRMVPISIKPRRAGDPASLVADVAKAEYLLGWRAGADLQRIVADAVQWASSPAYGAR